jgi:hypothetical protein
MRAGAMIRFTRDKQTGRIEKHYGAYYGQPLGYVLQPLKEGHTELFRGLPGHLKAVEEDKRSLQAQRMAEALYYQKNSTRFD